MASIAQRTIGDLPKEVLDLVGIELIPLTSTNANEYSKKCTWIAYELTKILSAEDNPKLAALLALNNQ